MVMQRARDTFCSFCGTAYTPPLAYPRRCPEATCGAAVWANPIPVAVLLLPVAHEDKVGLLVVRRGIEPRRGMLALVGGFVEEHESWQAGAAREAREEVGVGVDPAGIEPFWFVSTEPRPSRVLLFGAAPAIDARTLAPFAPNTEGLERGLIFGPGQLADVFAFPLHVRAAERWFASRGSRGPHDFTVV
jgi:ADP-ribose pyrophosphatase YjhB (NUDIX family)